MKRSNPTTVQIAALAVACAVVMAALSIVPLGIATQVSSNEHEPNDQPANATHIQEGVVVTGEVKEDPKDRIDIYAFEAKKGQHIVVNVTGLEDAPRPTQLTLSLHGPAYARGNDSTLDEIYATLGTTTNELTATAPVTGTYYVEVANEAAMGSSGRYAVSVNISGAVNTQSPTKINSCTVIDQPGRYVLTDDIEDSTTDQCIKIKSAQGVVFDGAGHTIDGVDDFPTGGIVVFGRSGASNVTVTNVTVTDWGTGITYEAATGEIRDSVVASNSRGIAFTYGAGGIVVANTTARGNDLAGFYVQDASDNLFVDDKASDNGWAYASVSSDGPSPVPSEDNTVKNLALDSATVSFESKDINLGAVESPPTSPIGLTNVGGYVNATSSGNDDDAFLALSVHYTDAAVANVNESTLRLYVFSDGNWSPVPGSSVNTKKGIVSANVTALANPTVLAPFGGDAGKTEQPSDDGDAPPDDGGSPPDNGSAPPDDEDDAPPDDGNDASSNDGNNTPSEDDDVPTEGEDAPADDDGNAPPDEKNGTPSEDGNAPPDQDTTVVCEAGSTDEVFGENDEDDDGDGAIDEDDEDNDGPSNDDDDGDGAVDEDDECDDGDDGSDEFNGNAEDDDDGDGAIDEDDEADSGNSDDVDNDGDGAVDEDDEADTDD